MINNVDFNGKISFIKILLLIIVSWVVKVYVNGCLC